VAEIVASKYIMNIRISGADGASAPGRAGMGGPLGALHTCSRMVIAFSLCQQIIRVRVCGRVSVLGREYVVAETVPAPADVDAELAVRFLPVLWTSADLYRVVEEPSAVYYKVERTGYGYAVLYVFEWPYQSFPPHEYDYEPVVVHADKAGRVLAVCYDGYHYFVECKTVKSGVTPPLHISNPWRSMDVGAGDVVVFPNEETPLIPLTGEVYERLRRRRPNPLKIHPDIYRSPQLSLEAEHWATFDRPSLRDFVRDLAANFGFSPMAAVKMVEALAYYASNIVSGIVARVMGRRLRSAEGEEYN